VHVWDLVEGKLEAKLDHDQKGKVKNEGAASDLVAAMAAQTGGNTVHSLSFHPEKAELVTATAGKVYVWRGASVIASYQESDDEDEN